MSKSLTSLFFFVLPVLCIYGAQSHLFQNCVHSHEYVCECLCVYMCVRVCGVCDLCNTHSYRISCNIFDTISVLMYTITDICLLALSILSHFLEAQLLYNYVVTHSQTTERLTLLTISPLWINLEVLLGF